MEKTRKNITFYTSSISYIIGILIINMAFSITPIYHIGTSEVSLMDPIAGMIYLLRDFAQRELGHYKIFIAMVIGVFLSYIFADSKIAIASISAFTVGELIDWALFTFTKRPLYKRLLLSALISAPIDSIVFLLVIHRFNLGSLTLMILGKLTGIILLCHVWKKYRA